MSERVYNSKSTDGELGELCKTAAESCSEASINFWAAAGYMEAYIQNHLDDSVWESIDTPSPLRADFKIHFLGGRCFMCSVTGEQ